MFINKNFLRFIFSALLLVVVPMTYAVEQAGKRLPPIIHYVLNGEVDDQQNVTPSIPSGAFLEEDGLIVVEMESLSASEGWVVKNDDDSAIGSYLEWTDRNSLQNPGNGLISAKVYINNPGIYRFMWRSSIREGTSITDANDSFLKILANNFYGLKSSNQSIVCPRDQPESNRCSGDEPEGSSRDGWFKVYRSGGPAIDWNWRTFTSDNDAHSIYAEFDQIGEYEIQISARSQSHAIDRFVLFKSLNLADNVNEDFATDSARPESFQAP